MDHWICFLCLLRAAFCLINEPYKLHLEEATFDHAVETCKKNGFLTDMAEEEEVAKIISHIEGSNPSGTLHFWVGLRKSNLECVLDDHPLKGFKWTVSNSSHTNVSKWKAQPTHTCTSVLCGLLTVEYNRTKVTDWGWNGNSCKEKHPFICKINQQVDEMEPKCDKDKPHIFDAREILPVKDNSSLLEVHCISNDTFYLHCSSDTKEWTLGSGSGEISQMCLACNLGYIRNDMGSCIDLDECAEKPCKLPFRCINTQGSYVCECDAAMGYVPTEDSKSCEKLPLPTDAPAGSTTTFQFLPLTNPSPQATDGQGSPPTLPPGPSTTTAGASVILETSDTHPRIWIPVLAAVLSLVFLVVIISIIVKCCLRKRSKKLSKEKGGKSKETVVLKAADSMEEINQKDIVLWGHYMKKLFFARM
ncbi:hypothetical protein ANANG_G00019620 [Anguilla anguilla]|uniref:C-type lectin domain-containing protein n=1 Tax=Anguilla anguilla TaxID=7936 RepID=A0A9D3MYX8_ANGAN|nr:hypothetical protein ANANG_G00019620 [Anguilla anguilla]